MNSNIQIVECKTRNERRKFLQFSWELHRNDSYWVPPLLWEREEFIDPEKNPFYQHAEIAFFVARRSRKTIGTIAAIMDHEYNRVHHECMGYFGFFECVKDVIVAHALLDTAADWCKKRGATAIRGPANFSANDDIGLLIDGFNDSPRILMPYNPSYYREIIEEYGFVKVMDLFAYKWDIDNTIQDLPTGFPPKLASLQKKIQYNKDILIRKVSLLHFDEEVIRLARVYNEALRENWGFVPLTDSEARFLGKRFRTFIDPDLFWIAEHKGEPIGIALCVPDINEPLKLAKPQPISGIFSTAWLILKLFWYWKILHKVTWFHGAVMGVLKEWQGHGIAISLYSEPLRAAARKGYKHVDLSWVLETNTKMNRDILNMGGQKYKTYRIYQKHLNSTDDSNRLSQ